MKTKSDESNIFNPLDARYQPDGIDFLVNMLISMIDGPVDCAKKEMLKDVISALPPGATMATLIANLKEEESRRLGINIEVYDALSTLTEVLTNINENKSYGGFFNEGE